jgi:hypothetical protein
LSRKVEATSIEDVASVRTPKDLESRRKGDKEIQHIIIRAKK